MNNVSEVFNKNYFVFGSYIDFPRWVSYYHQIDCALKLVDNPEYQPRVLVVGKGDNIVPTVISSFGISVTTFDYSADLAPDVVGDVKDIEKHFGSNSFDLIVCCQVLEHLEYSYFDDVLAQLSRISKYVLLSLPHRRTSLFSGAIRLPYITLKPKVTIPRFYRKYFWRFSDSQHYWEIGIKGYSSRKVRKDISKHFYIAKEFSDSLNTYNKFYVLNSGYAAKGNE